MDTVSIVFTCKTRRSLTELTLRRLLEVMPKPFEIILVYDGIDTGYIDFLLSIYEFEHIVMNPKNKTIYGRINDGLDGASGRLFMHLENDYWSTREALETALETLENNVDIDFVRLEFLPFTESQCERMVNGVCVLRKGTPYAFNFNPHIRRKRFPMGRFIEEKITHRQTEGLIAEKWRGTSACVTENPFRHLGIYDAHKHFKKAYVDRFTLKRGTTGFDALETFNGFCSNQHYRRLFEEYLNDYGNKHN